MIFGVSEGGTIGVEDSSTGGWYGGGSSDSVAASVMAVASTSVMGVGSAAVGDLATSLTPGVTERIQAVNRQDTTAKIMKVKIVSCGARL